MKKQVFQQLKTEFAIITGIFLLSFIAFKIAFMPESAFVILKAVFAFFWIFILPGYFIMLYWLDELKLHERMIVGIAASASAIGLSSYYLGVLGLHIKHHVILLPLLSIIAGLLLSSSRYSLLEKSQEISSSQQ